MGKLKPMTVPGKIGVLCGSFLIVIVFGCRTRKPAEYVFPDYIQESRRPELIKTLEKGRVLFEEYCESCHNSRSKAKGGAPDFSQQQIDTYSAWTIRKDPRSHAAAMNMSQDQLQEIFMYLKFRKKG